MTHRGQGGRFAPARPTPLESPLRRVVAAGRDGEGRTDFWTVKLESSDRAFLWNLGSGAFQPAVPRDLEGKLHGVAAGNIDGPRTSARST